MHKLGTLPFFFGNTCPQFHSSLKLYYVLAIAKNKDMESYGIDSLLAAFVDELQTLCIEGVFQ